jgi:hypothetical protein
VAGTERASARFIVVSSSTPSGTTQLMETASKSTQEGRRGTTRPRRRASGAPTSRSYPPSSRAPPPGARGLVRAGLPLAPSRRRNVIIWDIHHLGMSMGTRHPFTRG